MKSLLSVLTIALLLMGCSAGDKTGEATAEAMQAEMLGAPITITEATDINMMMAEPANYLEKQVMITGEVMGRCSGSGCWISINRGEDAEGLIVQAADKSFIFPADCVGKQVSIQGTLTLRNPEAMVEHEKEAGEADHVCPNPEYFFAPTGLKVGA